MCLLKTWFWSCSKGPESWFSEYIQLGTGDGFFHFRSACHQKDDHPPQVGMITMWTGPVSQCWNPISRPDQFQAHSFKQDLILSLNKHVEDLLNKTEKPCFTSLKVLQLPFWWPISHSPSLRHGVPGFSCSAGGAGGCRLSSALRNAVPRAKGSLKIG